MDHIEEAITKLTSNQLTLTAIQNTMNTKIDELLQKIAQLETSQHSPTSSTANQCSIPSSPNPHRMKLEVPRFDGTNPLGWIFKIHPIFWISHHPWPRTLYHRFFLYGGSCFGLVPMDDPQWSNCIMVRPPPSVGSSLCFVIVRGSDRGFVQTYAERIRQWLSFWVWNPCQPHHWFTFSLPIELLRFWIISRDSSWSTGITTLVIDSGGNSCSTPGGKVQWQSSCAPR